MLSKSILSLVVLGAAVSAFQIPQDQGDGVYVYGDDGTHSKVANVTQPSRIMHAVGPGTQKRGAFPVHDSGCTGDVVTASDWLQSSNQLIEVCSKGPGHGYPTVSKGSHMYAQSNGAVTFMCNYGENNPCVAEELQSALGYIGQKCLNYEGGWALNNDWKKSYGYDSSIAIICGNE